MPQVSPYLVSYAQSAWAATLPETATIVRTGVQVSCRLSDDHSNQRFPGVSPWMVTRRKLITVPAGTDIRSGDVVTITGKGSYGLVDIDAPMSYPPLATAICVQRTYADGSAAIPFNAQVTFQRTTANGVSAYPTSGTASVYALRVATIREPEPWMLAFPWIVVYDPAYAFTGTDAGVIRAGDEIIWSELNNGRASLEKVLKVYGPLPYCMAGFSEVE